MLFQNKRFSNSLFLLSWVLIAFTVEALSDYQIQQPFSTYENQLLQNGPNIPKTKTFLYEKGK